MSGKRNGDFRRQTMSAELALLTLSEDLLEAVAKARVNGLADNHIKAQLLDYAGAGNVPL